MEHAHALCCCDDCVTSWHTRVTSPSTQRLLTCGVGLLDPLAGGAYAAPGSVQRVEHGQHALGAQRALAQRLVEGLVSIMVQLAAPVGGVEGSDLYGTPGRCQAGEQGQVGGVT